MEAAAVTEGALLVEPEKYEEKEKERTKGILPVLKHTAERTERIAERTKQTKKILQNLPSVAAVPQQQDNETRRLNEEVLTNLNPGDVIRFFEEYHEHWAVYAGKDEKGDTSIIHWWSENVASRHWFNWWKESDVASNPRIMFSSFWKFADKMKVEKENSDSIDGTKVLIRAKAFKQKLEEEEKSKTKTNPDLFDSCEHFAKWCHYGLGVTPVSAKDIGREMDVWKFVHGIFTNSTADGKAIMRNAGVLSQLSPGDVVRFSRGSYNHWATYIGLDKKDKTRLKSVIHWWDKDGTADPDMTIVPFWELAGNCTAEKINTDELCALTEYEAVEKANDLIEEYESKRKFQGIYKEAFEFHCSEDFAKFFYLKLMSKTTNKKEVPIAFDKSEIYSLCTHRCKVPFLPWKSRINQMAEILRTLESNQLIQIIDCVLSKQARTTKLPPEKLICELCDHPWDPCSVFTRMTNKDILITLKSGDLIEFVENSRNHWGVYIGKENGVDSFIHWTAYDHAIDPCRMSDDWEPCIEIRSVTELEKAEKLEKHNSDTHEKTIIDGTQVVERIKAFNAKIKAGEENGEEYDDLFRDCEQFAKWCRYGLGLKRLQISTVDINKIKDIRMFVQGDFSVLPWRISPNEDIRVLRMLQLGKSIAEFGKNRRHVKSSKGIQALQRQIVKWFPDNLVSNLLFAVLLIGPIIIPILCQKEISG